MKEQPILMSTENVEAILEGRKTQTRRPNGLEEINQDPGNWNLEWVNPNTGIASFARGDIVAGAIEVTDITIRCPYGQVGDRLWVRETLEKSDKGIPTRYAADGCPVMRDGESIDWPFRKSPLPSIHMPRWASRINLEITEIRVERVQEIMEEGAKAEGISQEYIFKNGLYLEDGYSYRRGYRRLWNFINKEYPWESNPWVWVISFKRVQGGEQKTQGQIKVGGTLARAEGT